MKRGIRTCLGIGIITFGIGIVAVVVAFGLGGMKSVDASSLVTFSDNVTGVSSINFELPYGNINIVNGESFEVRISNVDENAYSSEVIDGIWHIKGKSKSINIFNLDTPIFSIGGSKWGLSSENEVKIDIILPLDKEYDKVLIEIGVGKVNIDSINGKEINIETGIGEVIINSLSSDHRTELTIGTGSIHVLDGNIENLYIECGVGSLNYEGTIKSRCEVDSGVGNVSMTLDNKYENCYFNVDSGLGTVNINGNRIKSGTIKNATAEIQFYLNSGIGNINIDLK